MSIHTRSLRLPCAALLSLSLLVGLAACSKSQEDSTPTAESPSQAPVVTADSVVSEAVLGMGADDLRSAASQSMRAQRLYSPAGDNAMEYYLALREKQPGQASVSSALTDLMPYALMAAEQSILRDEFAEAQRLIALMEKADPNAPALPRLKTSLADAQASLGQRRSAAEAEQARQQEAATQREAEAEARRQQQLQQQQAQQQQAQQAAAAQREADERAAEARAAEARAAEARAAEARAAEARAAEARAAEARAAEARAAQARTPPTRTQLRPISTPAPRYPADALRAGTSGEVLVEITVATDGSVSNARVIRANPPRIFDRETLAAVRRWRFEPVDQPVTTRRSLGFDPNQ